MVRFYIISMFPLFLYIEHETECISLASLMNHTKPFSYFCNHYTVPHILSYAYLSLQPFNLLTFQTLTCRLFVNVHLNIVSTTQFIIIIPSTKSICENHFSVFYTKQPRLAYKLSVVTIRLKKSGIYIQ